MNPFSNTDMVFIDDVVFAIKESLRLVGAEIFNISSGEKYSVYELAQMIKTITASKSTIDIESQDIHDAMQLNLNIEKAERVLKIKPKKISRSVSEIYRELK